VMVVWPLLLVLVVHGGGGGGGRLDGWDGTSLLPCEQARNDYTSSPILLLPVRVELLYTL
jgi:hypothetical protein